MAESMVTGKAMNELLEYLIRHLSFLYNEQGARFVNSETHGADALVELELKDIRLRLVRDRGQLFLDFQSVASSSLEWFSVDVVYQLVKKHPGDQSELDDRYVKFVHHHLAEISAAFSPANWESTERHLHQYERERAKRMFG